MAQQLEPNSYSHLGDGVHNGIISITQWGFISACYKEKSIGQWGKNLVCNGNGVLDNLGRSVVI